MIASRRYSIYTPSGRIFLLATADAYGYTLDANGKIVDDTLIVTLFKSIIL